MEIAGLSFTYALHELPPGRLPFRRWRWELWHGANLEAAGWRVTQRDAARALRVQAARVGYRLFGLDAPEPTAVDGHGFHPGMAIRMTAGGIAFTLLPRGLEQPAY